MYKPLLTIFLFSISSIAFAQENATDSIPTYDLEEIQVQASRVIRKADMDIYHPSESSVEQSANGLQLLTRLAIPSLMVDEVMGSITASGSSVQLRINGRIATVEQVRNLNPESVKRIEWIDNPGLRYNGADYVLNIIVTNPSKGGSLRLTAQPMFNVLFGNAIADVKLNSGKSQWEFSGFYKLTSSKKVHRDYNETFTFPNGDKLNRIETPINGKIDNDQANGLFSYSFIKPDTIIFYANIYSWFNLDNLSRFNGLLTLSDEGEKINLLSQFKGKGATPTLTLYLEQHFRGKQTLVIDFSTSLYSGYSSSIYRENYLDADNYITDIYTHIRDFNQAYAIEADYIKEWNNSKFTGGLNYNANRNRSKYRNLDNAIFHQHQNKIYFFGEYFQRIGKFTFTGGLGAQYTEFFFKETEQGNHSWNLRPQATVTFSPNSKNQFRVNFSSWQTTPSLSETNIAPQQTDGFQWNIGNPNLKTYNNYQLNLRYGFNYGKISGNFNINAYTGPKAIAPYLYWEDERLITSYENSKGKQSLSFRLSPQIEVIPNWLMVSGSLEYLNERTQGQGYKLYNHNWNGNVQGILTHWNFTLQMQYGKAQRTLWGEKLSWGEDFSSITLFYTWKEWQFGAVMFMPFGQYDQGSKMMSKWNTNEEHLRLDFKMFGLGISYNLQWGRQKHGVNKLIDSDASVDKSSAKSR